MGNDEAIDRATAAHTTRNIGLAGQLLKQMLANPELLDDIPNEANLIVLPFDDPATTLRNIAQAMRLAGRGESVYLRRINGPTPGIERTLAHLGPGISHADLMLSVDFATGTMTFDFSGLGSGRQLAWFPVGETVDLLVDRASLDVVGYRVPDALLEHLHARPEESHQASGTRTSYRILDTETAVATFTEDLIRHAA